MYIFPVNGIARKELGIFLPSFFGGSSMISLLS